MFDFSGVETKWYVVLLTILAIIAVIAAVIFMVTIINKKRNKAFKMETRDITYGAICLTVAYVLSFFGYKLPQGGTVTPASVLPIMIYCYYFGFRKGLIITTAYMLLQLLQNPYIVSPWSLLLDYVIPYMALGFVGIFSYSSKRYYKVLNHKKPIILAHLPIILGGLIYIIIRYTCHVLAGVLFYSEFAWEGWSTVTYSLAYNSFVLIDFAVAIVAGIALLSSKAFNAFMASKGDALKNTNTAAKNDQSA